MIDIDYFIVRVFLCVHNNRGRSLAIVSCSRGCRIVGAATAVHSPTPSKCGEWDMCRCCPQDRPHGGPGLLTAGRAVERGILSEENGTRVVSVLFLFDNVIYNTAGLLHQSRWTVSFYDPLLIPCETLSLILNYFEHKTLYITWPWLQIASTSHFIELEFSSNSYIWRDEYFKIFNWNKTE